MEKRLCMIDLLKEGGRRRLAACFQNTDSKAVGKRVEKVCVEELTDLNS